jgi:phage terminase large subunit GpA-like protein
LVVETKPGSGGQKVRQWKLRKGLANEALDTRVYAYAALVGLYHTRRLNLAKASAALSAYHPPEVSAPVLPPGLKPPAARRVGRSSFMGEA